jgi:hypoxanthine phosphoribosyltransferase
MEREPRKSNRLKKFDLEAFTKVVSYGVFQIIADGVEKDRMGRLPILAEGLVNLANMIVHEKANTLVLLDKSARPVAHLLKAYWRLTYPEVKIPAMRFMNIGQEGFEKDYNKKMLELLYKAHKSSMNGKTVIVADEGISSGTTISRAKKVIEAVFPKTRRFIYTAVFEKFPRWYSQTQYLGVYDLDDLPLRLTKSEEKEFMANEPDTHISKTITGVFRRNPILKNHYSSLYSMVERQKCANNIRAELTYLAQVVACTTQGVPAKANPPIHNIDVPCLDEFLNR